MPAPSKDWINEAVDAVVTALKASVDFMSPDAQGAPPNAAGTIMRVEDDLPETEAIPGHYLPHAGVVHLNSDALEAESSAGETELAIDIGIRIYHRGADRRSVWRKVQQAAAAVQRVVALEVNANGGMFGGFASNALFLGAAALDVKEPSGFGAMQLVRIQIWATRTDY